MKSVKGFLLIEVAFALVVAGTTFLNIADRNQDGKPYPPVKVEKVGGTWKQVTTAAQIEANERAGVYSGGSGSE